MQTLDATKLSTPEGLAAYMVETQKYFTEHEKKFEEFKKDATAKWSETAEAKAAFEKIDTEFTEFKKDRQKFEADLKAHEEILKQIQRPPVTSEAKPADVKTAWGNTLRDIALMRKPDMFGEVKRSMFSRENDLETYAKAAYGPEHFKSYTTQNLLTAGALAMPPELLREIIDQAKLNITNIRPYARNLRTSASSLQIPVQTAAAGAGWTAETGTRSADTSVNFGSVEIRLHSSYVLYQASHDMIADSMFPLEAEMNRIYGDRLSQLHGTAFVNGTGTGEPEGFMKNASVSYVAQAETSTLTNADGIKGLLFGLKAVYRNNAKFCMNSNTALKLSVLKGEDGNYLISPLSGPMSFTLNQKEVIYSEDMPSVTTDTYPIILADWSQFYCILDSSKGSIALTDPYSNKTTGLVDFMLNVKVGGRVICPEAGLKLKIAAS